MIVLGVLTGVVMLNAVHTWLDIVVDVLTEFGGMYITRILGLDFTSVRSVFNTVQHEMTPAHAQSDFRLMALGVTP